jgi:integrase
MLFQRPGDLRCMEWVDIDFDAGEWNIPIPKMKVSQKEKIRRKDETHCVPLSEQAIYILKQLQPFSGHSKYCFPSYRTPDRPITDATLTAALHRMGYQNEQTLHGFRAVARTVLDEVLGFPPDQIEHQLAHQVRDSLGRAYNRTSHLPARRQMMQQWADYLDGLKAGAKVIPLRQAG